MKQHHSRHTGPDYSLPYSPPFLRPGLSVVLCLFLCLTLTACDNLNSTDNEDSFTELDDIGETTASNELVLIENQFGDKIAMEFWLGDQIEYNLDDGKVYAKNLKKLAPAPVKLEALHSTSINISKSKDLLAVVGVRVSEENVDPEKYEYLTQARLFNVINGSGIRLSDQANLTAFSTSQCLTGLTTTQRNETLAYSNLLINAANAVASQWKPIKDITNPLNTVLQYAKSVISDDQNLQLQFLADVNQWTLENNVLTHTEELNDTNLTLTTQYLWGSVGGHSADEPISDDLKTPANYFTNLKASLDGSDIDFTFDSTGPLAPLIGLPANQSEPGTYRVSMTSWVSALISVYKSLKWNINIKIVQDNVNGKLNADLSYVGRPSFNIKLNLDLDNLELNSNNRLEISQNPFNLILKDGITGSRVSRNQTVTFDNWNLKVFPDDDGNKGVLAFDVKGDKNFDYSGRIAYNSDADINANVFLKCGIDDSPIVY